MFTELKQSSILGLVSLLYPLAPIVAFFGIRSIGIVAGLSGAALCFVPGLIVSRRCMGVFQRSGTDRSDSALAVSTQSFATALGGLLYLAAVAIILGGGYMHEMGAGGA